MAPHVQEIIDALNNRILGILNKIDERQVGNADKPPSSIEALMAELHTREDKRSETRLTADSPRDKIKLELAENSALIDACQGKLEQLPAGSGVSGLMLLPAIILGRPGLTLTGIGLS